MALLNEKNFSVCPTPLAICVKETGIAALKPYYPDIEQITSHLRYDGKKARYLPPPQNTIVNSSEYFPVNAFFFSISTT